MLTPSPIPDVDTQFSRIRRTTLVLVSIICLGVVFSPDSSFLWGMVVGLLAGLTNAFFLANRLRKMVLLDPSKAKGFMQQGFGFRFTLILVVLYVASNLPWISLYGVGAGLMIPPLLAIFDLALCAMREAMASQAMQVKHHSKTEGGEKI